MRTNIDPSLIRASGYMHRQTKHRQDQTITFVHNNFLKNIQDELMEQESSDDRPTNITEIVNVKL